MLNTDDSYQLFHIINSKNFFFQENRFGIWPVQLPLLISIYLQLPVKALLYIYSISFPLEYLLIIWINIKFFKCKEAALATVLSMIIGVAHTFFQPMTETHQLLAFSCLLYGLFYAKKRFNKLWIYYLVKIIIITWCFFLHPIAIFTTFFVIGLAFLQKKITRVDLIGSILYCLLFIIVRLLLTPKGSYDSAQYEHLLKFKDSILHFSSLYPYRYLVSKIPTTYLSASVIILIVWLRYKKYTELIFCTLCFIIFTVISMLTFSAGDADSMMEKSFMPGVFMFVLIYSILFYQTKNRKVYLLLTTLFCTLSFINIVKAGNEYKLRLNLLSSIINNMDSRTPKIIANFSDFDENIIRLNNWATSVDAMILSKCMGASTKTIFLTEDKYQFASDTTKSDLFLFLIWEPYWNKKLDPYYFDLPSLPYKIFNNRNSMKNIVQLKTITGKYFCADRSRNSEMFANRTDAKDWEMFYYFEINDSTFNLKSTNGKYVCADQSNNGLLIANRDVAKQWETFIKIKQKNGKYVLKTSNGKFVSIDTASDCRLIANKDIIGNNECFDIIEMK